MSVLSPERLPAGDSPERARAKETLWRLTALAMSHPTPEFHAALVEGRFHDAFCRAWMDVTGQAWLDPGYASEFRSFEAGYISAFLHGRTGKPVAALLAGDHERLLAGLTRPVFMLNIAAFYKHFGLKAATADEGRIDEPDHLASMAEFMAVLCHLEAQALESNRDPSAYRRAQRDFLCRYLARTLDTIAELLRREPVADLDPALFRLLQDMSAFAGQQIAELEARIGPFRDPDAARPPAQEVQAQQNLWE